MFIYLYNSVENLLILKYCVFIFNLCSVQRIGPVLYQRYLCGPAKDAQLEAKQRPEKV